MPLEKKVEEKVEEKKKEAQEINTSSVRTKILIQFTELALKNYQDKN
jgi:hypothetical protein